LGLEVRKSTVNAEFGGRKGLRREEGSGKKEKKKTETALGKGRRRRGPWGNGERKK